MGSFAKELPDLIRAAATNWRSVVALCLLLAAAVVIALKVVRNKQLLLHLNQFPEKDRLKAFQMELGGVKLRSGLSPEQWLKHKTNTYIFAGVIIICLMITVVVITLFSAGRPSGKVTGMVTHAPEPLSHPAESDSGESSSPPAAPGPRALPVVTPDSRNSQIRLLKLGQIWCGLNKKENGMPAERIVSYRAVLENEGERLSYSAPYLDLLRKGGPVSGVNPLGSPFKWRYPLFGVRVVNNSPDTRVLTRAKITILTSRIETQPILLVDDLSVNELVIRNEGWGQVVNPSLRLSISENLAPDAVPLTAPEERTVNIQTFDSVTRIPIAPPGYLKDETLVKVSGEIAYDWNGARKKLQFNTRISLQVRPAAPPSANREYEAFFKAGEAPQTILVDALNEPLEARGYAYFFIRLGSDKSSHSQVKFEFQMDNQQIISAGEFKLDLFVPRTTEETARARRQTACGGD